MRLCEQDLIHLRNRIHNLDLKQKSHQNVYTANRRFYFEVVEKSCCAAYDDGTGRLIRDLNGKRPVGKRTVGMGFNMDRDGAKKEWEEALPHVPFEGVRCGKQNLTQKDVEILFDQCLENREKILRYVYGPVWDQLRPNERLAKKSISQLSSSRLPRTESSPAGYCGLRTSVCGTSL